MGAKVSSRGNAFHRRRGLDLQVVLAELHREYELISNAIEKLEQLPSPRKRGPGRPRLWPWTHRP
jgi:hypothetical protein